MSGKVWSTAAASPRERLLAWATVGGFVLTAAFGAAETAYGAWNFTVGSGGPSAGLAIALGAIMVAFGAAFLWSAHVPNSTKREG